jgi:glyoxylase-like metal-dependent hydrolase (beta-lactamase superfamily II)
LKHKYLIIIITILLIFVLLPKVGTSIQSDKIELLKQPNIESHNEVKIFAIETGYAVTLEGFTVAGGSLFKTKKVSHNAILILHPKGNLLIDTGIGNNVKEQFAAMPFFLKPLFDYTKLKSAQEILDANHISIKNILLTHMHWDHASGLKDFKDVAIYSTKPELDFAKTINAKPPAYIHSQYDGISNFNPVQFRDGAYEVFKESFDFYKDGTVVLVSLSGHSPGSIGIFVNLSATERYFFTGDITWTKAGFETNAHKFIVSSLLVDYNRDLIGKEINRISDLLKLKPEIKVMPAHDNDVYESIEKLK